MNWDKLEPGAARKQETSSPVRALLDAQPKIRLGPLVMADKERFLVVFKARPDPTIAADWPQPLPIASFSAERSDRAQGLSARLP